MAMQAVFWPGPRAPLGPFSSAASALPTKGGLWIARLRAYLWDMIARAIPLAFSLCLLASLPAGAHPHIFVDAGLRLVLDPQGRPTAVEVTWRYDELYSMLLVSDLGLDPDFDLQLTPQEIADTLGFDLNWGEGFEGGLVLHQGEQPLALGAPEPLTLSLTPGGQLETTHRRPVQGARAGVPVDAQIYDPQFYVAFEMILDITVADRSDCRIDLIRADIDAAYVALGAALAEIGGAVAAEDNFPPVGALFADRAVIACPG